MEAFYKDNHNTIYCLDFRKNELPDESVQMVCTSPPYWGLRKYSGEQELIWGDNHCEHQFDTPTSAIIGSNTLWRPDSDTGLLSLPAIDGKWGETQKGGTDRQRKEKVGNFCSLCGAWKGAYGLEPTPEMYIEHTIEILREIRRVLRKDGVVFWNIGDSYWGSQQGYGTKNPTPKQASNVGTLDTILSQREPLSRGKQHNILKPKDLCLIPFRIAIAAQEDGWWVRSVIIWSKPNPMPESVTDRPTESHEYILMLTKSGTTQYWTHPRKRGSRTKPKPDYIWTHKRTGLVVDYPPVSDRILKEFWTRHNLWRGHDYYWDADAVREPYSLTERWGGDVYKGAIKKGSHGEDAGLDRERSCFPNTGRNIRSVWEFPTQPYPEAHFAVFPEKLPEICIKAATPEVGCCSKCGAPWGRIVELGGVTSEGGSSKGERAKIEWRGEVTTDKQNHSMFTSDMKSHEHITKGWQPTCKCNADKVPSVVVDPFAGACTTLYVAKKLNRYAEGYDTSAEYCHLGADRCRQQILI